MRRPTIRTSSPAALALALCPVLVALALAAWVPAAASAVACRQLGFEAVVGSNAGFQRDIGSGLRFRLEPQGDDSGWHFEIGPSNPVAGGLDKYVYLVTPPWRGRAATALDTSHGVLAQQVAEAPPRRFRFLLRPADARRGEAALERILWPRDEASAAAAMKTLDALPRGHGVLRVLRADILPGDPAAPRRQGGDGDFGRITGLAVSVQLTVPAGFKAAPGLRTQPAPCPPAGGILNP